MKKYIAQNIRFLRNRRNWTQEKLSATLHVKRSRIGAWEEGRAEPPYEIAREYCRLFHVTFEQLYEIDLSSEKTERNLITVPTSPEKETKQENHLQTALLSAPANIKKAVKLLLQPYLQPHG